ncbi:MAG: hypothetical protein M1826_002210 [Phylliscum demangeonii]|nr:MAG: hypothetical protein M1826_002210 [Phylliscum demangeonii]
MSASLDEYGYGQTFEDDNAHAESWIMTMDWNKWHDNGFKRDQAHADGGDRTTVESQHAEQKARDVAERKQRVRQNEAHFQQRAAQDRTRHPIADGDFTPANDADYQADVRQIQRDFEQRMTEAAEWAKQAHPTHRVQRTAQMKELAEKIRASAMKKAYERHDIRKGGWNKIADYHKRQLAEHRHQLSNTRSRQFFESHRQLSRKDIMRLRSDLKRLIQKEERAYAKSRPMPPDAEQLEHAAKHTFKSLGPAFFAWEKRASTSHAPGVQKVGGLLKAE